MSSSVLCSLGLRSTCNEASLHLSLNSCQLGLPFSSLHPSYCKTVVFVPIAPLGKRINMPRHHSAFADVQLAARAALRAVDAAITRKQLFMTMYVALGATQ